MSATRIAKGVLLLGGLLLLAAGWILAGVLCIAAGFMLTAPRVPS